MKRIHKLLRGRYSWLVFQNLEICEIKFAQGI